MEYDMPNTEDVCIPGSVVRGDIRKVSSATIAAPPPDPLTERTRATWTAGNFDRIGRYTEGAAEFIGRLRLRPGERVLDVACGCGNLAMPAARAGAAVTGVDIAPNLIAQAREHARAEALDIQFDEGDVECLPYPSRGFDTVVTMFGAMFAPRPDRTASELMRVTRSGGRIAMANWSPDGHVARMFRVTAGYLSPPTDVPSPLLWGDPKRIAERFGAGIERLTVTPRTIDLAYPYSPAGVVELFQAFYGPTVRAFEALGPEERVGLRRDLERLWDEGNLATDGGTRVAAEYVEVVAVVR
jgi:ubiquinone/menaquinone biosynthesis C-methylase UbiE